MINFPQRNWTDYGGEVTVGKKSAGFFHRQWNFASYRTVAEWVVR